jgi:hypothetical protein
MMGDAFWTDGGVCADAVKATAELNRQTNRNLIMGFSGAC